MSKNTDFIPKMPNGSGSASKKLKDYLDSNGLRQSWKDSSTIKSRKNISPAIMAFLLLPAFSAYSAEVTFHPTDGQLKTNIKWLCDKGTVKDCDKKTDAEIVGDAIEMLMCNKISEYTGVCSKSPASNNIRITVEYDSYDVECDDCARTKDKSVYACRAERCEIKR
jgi:hypothetical protein